MKQVIALLAALIMTGCSFKLADLSPECAPTDACTVAKRDMMQHAIYSRTNGM